MRPRAPSDPACTNGAPICRTPTYQNRAHNLRNSGYVDGLRAQEPKPLVDPHEIQSDADWARLGQRVFDELDQPLFRTDDHPERDHIIMRSVHTDPSLALRTRKGTGLYKVSPFAAMLPLIRP